MKRCSTLPALLLAACAGPGPGVLPPQIGPGPEPELTLVWVGQGLAERLEGERWVRLPEFDYEFSVEQRRYADHWESVKHLRRRHPAYDGSAGPREQTYFFRQDFTPAGPDGQLRSRVRSTLGEGEGRSDVEFRTAELVLRADVSSFAPFDTYRIAQRYAYEDAQLSETVTLAKGQAPWVRNQESARLFARHAFPGAPTRAR